jgi:LmbE family N-acetylglucosaminyl deacetylase
MSSPSYDKASFYFAAHPDDWQLFMNPSAFEDVMAPATKAVFIHVTAGDAGLGMGSGGRLHPYYLARENGADSAIRFMADANGIPVATSAGQMQFNAHSIARASYRNTVTYFLRAPDGNPEGSGYAETGCQSLKRLAAGEIAVLSTIDRSTVYRGWNDFVATLRAIMHYERAARVQVNVTELDPQINPDDHSDHLMTAKAALDAATGLQGVRRVHYRGYASSALPDNLAPWQRDMKCAVYAVTLAGVLALDHGVSWSHYDQSFIGRSYFRIDESGEPCDAGPGD